MEAAVSSEMLMFYHTTRRHIPGPSIFAVITLRIPFSSLTSLMTWSEDSNHQHPEWIKKNALFLIAPLEQYHRLSLETQFKGLVLRMTSVRTSQFKQDSTSCSTSYFFVIASSYCETTEIEGLTDWLADYTYISKYMGKYRFEFFSYSRKSLICTEPESSLVCDKRI
jgi:hypothetical protein